MTNFLVDILTPNSVVAKNIPVDSLLVPTERGEINILKDHTHIVSNLDIGKISLFGGVDDPDRYYSVSKGICKVLDGRVKILATTAEECHEIDLERARIALQNALNLLQKSDGLSDHEIQRQRDKVERARLRIQLAETYSK